MASSTIVIKYPSFANIWCFILVSALFFFQSLTEANKLLDAEAEALDKIFGPGKYDKRIRPAGTNDTGPIVVTVNLMIRNIDSISDVYMEYKLQVIFRQQWKDKRLSFDPFGQIKYLTLTDTNLVWMPDVFFGNEKEAHFHNVMQPNHYIRIYPDGDVLYSTRLSLTLACPMNLKLFPHDRQQCQILIASYGRTTNDLAFLWKDIDPVQITRNLHLPKFELEKFSTGYCNSSTITGEYSCLRLDLLFRRWFNYYLIQVYIPCCMLVISSWISFWLDHNAVAARIALGVTILLTLSLHVSRLNVSLPSVSYTKAIDVFTGVCMTFVFGALIEFALVNYYSRREKMKNNTKEEKRESTASADKMEEDSSALPMKQISSKEDEDVEAVNREEKPQHQKQNFFRVLLAKFPAGPKCIDVIARIGFPLFFVLFIIIYWSTYCQISDNEE